jgi:hypothetical protein
MEDYLNKYDSFSKIIVYDFNLGDGGIGDCIKFFMHTLNLCMKYNIKLYYLINNTLLEKYLKLKYNKMYIEQAKVDGALRCNTPDVENIQDGIYNIMTPNLFYSVYNNDTITRMCQEVFYFDEEVKINGCRLNVNNVNNYISVHLRLGDMYLETDSAFVLVKHDVRVYNEDKLFNFIKDNCSKNIIFFCDNHTYKLQIKNKFNNVIILNCDIGHTSLSNTTDKQTLDAVTEFYLMTNSVKICSASHSGFSIMASKFNNVPIISI